MSKQYIENSPSIQNKYSLFSKSGQRLYKRINNNIKIINKSKLSNTSNNSRGSVALRRTQLSNDKIYSREEQLIALNPSQLNADLSSLYKVVHSKNQTDDSYLQSQKNYRQRLFKIKSQKQLGSYNSKSKQSRLFNEKKLNKQGIQRLIMLQCQNTSSNSKNKQLQKRSIQSRKKSNQSSKDFKIIIQKGQNNRYRPIKSIKSSLKSYITLKNSAKDERQPKQKYQNQKNDLRYKNQYELERQNLKHLQNKYQNYYLKGQYLDKNQNRSQRKKWLSRQNDKNQLSKDKKYFEKDQFEEQRQKFRQNNHRNRQKYQDQKQMSNERKYRQKEKEYYQKKKYENQKYAYHRDERTNQNDEYNEYNEQNRNGKLKQNKNCKQNKSKRQSQYQKYYQISENNKKYKNKQIKQSQKYVQSNHKNISSSSKILDYEKQKLNSQSNLAITSNMTKKRKLNQKELNLNEKHQKYSNPSQNSNQLNYFSNKQIYDSDFQSPKKQEFDSKKSPKQLYSKKMNVLSKKETPVTQTFDSAMLSINSRLNLKQNNLNSQSLNTVDILQRIRIHLGTIKLISDYSNQFKKMYEQTQNWDELIFLAFKKYYVERVKVQNFLKSFKKHRKHESQRINYKANKQSSQNINTYSLNQISNHFQNHFQLLQKSQNPFCFQFAKIEDKEIRSIVTAPEFSIQLSKIQSQNKGIYNQLQEFYNISIQKGGDHINMLFCDNFSEQIYIFMLDQIDQLIPNLEDLSLFQITKIRLGKIVKCGLLIAYINGSHIQHFRQIITYQDIDRNSKRKKLKNYTTYDLYYDVFEKIVGD